MKNDVEQIFGEQDEPHSLPLSHKFNWLAVYGALGIIVSICLVFIVLYRQIPQKSAPVKKRTIPATRNVFTMVISPVDSSSAYSITQTIAATIGTDSATTQMIIGGTAVHKRCISLADFSNLTNRALRTAQPENLQRQALLLSHVAGVISVDTLPTTLYIIGKIDESHYEPVEKRITGAIKVMATWNAAFHNISVITYIPPASTPKGDSIRSAFIGAFRRFGHQVTEKPFPQQP